MSFRARSERRHAGAAAAQKVRCAHAVIATSSPMGQQTYERQILDALQALQPEQFTFAALAIGGLRSPDADRRYPSRWLKRQPAWLAEAAGRIVYRGFGLVHRMDLRLPPSRPPEVVTIHDLPVLRFEDEGAVPTWFAAAARRAAVVIVPSSFASAEVVELLRVSQDRIRVVPYGVAPAFRRPATPTGAVPPDSIPRRFVLHAAGATRRKNLDALAGAWRHIAQADDSLHLLLGGPPSETRNKLFAGLPRVRILGRIPPEDIAWLMSRTQAVVVPSIYEGFGLPALEGMAVGAPVVAARRGALPEVCGDAALIVEPTPNAIANGILEVTRNRELAARLRAAGPVRARRFSWTRAAEEHLEVYRAVVSTIA